MPFVMKKVGKNLHMSLWSDLTVLRIYLPCLSKTGFGQTALLKKYEIREQHYDSSENYVLPKKWFASKYSKLTCSKVHMFYSIPYISNEPQQTFWVGFLNTTASVHKVDLKISYGI